MLFVTYAAKELNAKLLLRASIISFVLLVLQDNRLRIGDGKAAAELKAAPRTSVRCGNRRCGLLSPNEPRLILVQPHSFLIAPEAAARSA